MLCCKAFHLLTVTQKKLFEPKKLKKWSKKWPILRVDIGQYWANIFFLSSNIWVPGPILSISKIDFDIMVPLWKENHANFLHAGPSPNGNSKS